MEVVQSRRMRSVEHVAHMEEIRNVCKIMVRKLEGITSLKS
jgi:hypothetical protein